MRIASQFSASSPASAPAAQSKHFDVVLRAAISDASQRHSGDGSTGYDAQSTAPPAFGSRVAGDRQQEASAANDDTASGGDATSAVATDSPAGTASAEIAAGQSPTSDSGIAGSAQRAAVGPSGFAAVPVVQGNSANGTAIDASLRGAATASQPSQPSSTSLSQGAAAASKTSASTATQQGAAAIDAQSTTKVSGVGVWSQTSNSTAAQNGTVRAKGNGGGAAARIVGPASKFNGTVQVVMSAPFFHSTSLPVARDASTFSAPESPIPAVTTPPVAEVAAPTSAPESRAGSSSYTHVQPRMSLTATAGSDDSIATQTASSLSSDMAASGNAAPSDAAVAPEAAAAQPGTAGEIAVPAEILNASMIPPPAPGDVPPSATLAGGQAQTAVASARSTSRAAGSGGSVANGAVGTPRMRSAEDGSGTDDASARGVQSAVQPVQHTHADASPAAVAAPVAAGPQIAPAAMVPPHTSLHDAAPAAPASDTSREAAMRGDPASQSQAVDDTAPASGIHAASLIQAMGGTEMRVGMHSAEFGDISIRTSVSAQQMLTQIAVDHSGLGQAISAHASSVQARLQEQYGVHAAIAVTQQDAAFAGERGGSFAGGQSGPGQREQQGFVHSEANETAPAPDETEIGLGQLAMARAGSNYRLDIRA